MRVSYLHVIDCADPLHLERIEQVETVLRDSRRRRPSLIHVYNKADILGVPPRVDRAETGMPMRVWLSAATGEGVICCWVPLPSTCFRTGCAAMFGLDVSQARLRSQMYEMGQVLSEESLKMAARELTVEY